ncbi:MAG TPA: phosphate uptake regulator PhoU [Fimbriimonas sp.]|nr:phosphate uptake regulator PhoU [Fimbriimonas sp.]
MAQQETRLRYTESLRTLEADAVRLGSLVLEMVSLSTRMALDEDESLTDKVLGWEREADAMERDIVERVIVVLAMESPVARDLLFLTATLFFVNELEKIGDEATKLASRIQKLQGEFPFEMNDLLREMSTLAQSNLRDSIRLYSQYSGEGALALVAKDEAVDRAYKTSRKLLLDMIRDDPENSRQFLRCLEIFHALEHVSDRATDIAKRLQACYEPFVKVSKIDGGS